MNTRLCTSTGWKAIRILPAGTILHKQDWFQEDCYKADFKDDGNPVNDGGAGDAGGSGDDFIGGCRERFFHERPYLRHESLLFITWTTGGGRPGNSAASNLLKKSIVPKESLDNRRRVELLETVSKFQKLLSDSSLIQIKRMLSPEITGSSDKPGLLERYLFLLKGGERPVLKDIQLRPDWKIGEFYPQLFTLADVEHLPASCGPMTDYTKYATDRTRFSVGFAAPVGLLLPVNHVYNQYIRILDTCKTLKRLEAKRKRLQSLSAYSRENSIAKDATADYLNEAIGDNRLPVQAHFNLLAWTESKDSLKELRGNASAAISQLGAVPYQETAGAPQIWWAGLLGNEGALPENECFDTFVEQASCFLNMETAYKSSNSPFGIRLGDRLSGLPVHVDISDEPMKKGIITNRNKIVVGGSGSGKSMFMNHLLQSYVSRGAHCIVVDVGHSYEGLCGLLDGYYFTYTDAAPIAFNPFYIPKDAVLDTEKKESIKTLLVALWKQGDETFRRSEYVAISNALSGFYSFLKNTETRTKLSSLVLTAFMSICRPIL